MDNVTHSLIACGAARVMEPSFHGRLTARQRSALYVTSLIANNIPDGDFVFALFNPEAKMGSLLHHRGYTHSVLAVPVLGLLSAALGLALCGVWAERPREGRGSRAPLLACALAGILGVVLHIVADSWNDYGIHPFTPFWNRWFYGDTLFIVEPLLWMALAWAIPRSQGRKGAVFTALRRGVVALGLGLLCFYPGASWPVAVWALLWAAALWGYQRVVARPLLLWLPVAVLVFIFSLCSHSAKNLLARNVMAQVPVRDVEGAVVGVVDPQVKGLSRITDIMVSPSPGDPLCWRAFVQLEDLEAAQGPRLLSHMGFVSLWPRLLPPDRCHVRQPAEHSAAAGPPALSSDAHVHWVRSSELLLEDVHALELSSCRFREFLAFARYPFLQKDGAGLWHYGDLRYDFSGKPGFAEFAQAPGDPGPCLNVPAPWVTPFRR